MWARLAGVNYKLKIAFVLIPFDFFLFPFDFLELFQFHHPYIACHFRVLKDERGLTARFGEPYLDYMRRVNRWLPGLF